MIKLDIQKAKKELSYGYKVPDIQFIETPGFNKIIEWQKAKNLLGEIKGIDKLIQKPLPSSPLIIKEN